MKFSSPGLFLSGAANPVMERKTPSLYLSVIVKDTSRKIKRRRDAGCDFSNMQRRPVFAKVLLCCNIA